MTYRLEPKRIALYALRGLILYFFFALILSMTTKLVYADGIRLPGMGMFSAASFSRDLGLSFNFAHLVTILVIPFLYYSVARILTLSDAWGYMMAEETDPEGRRLRYADAFSSRPYLIMLAATVAGYIIFPLSFGFGHLAAWPDFAAVLGKVAEKVLFGIVLLPGFALLLALANVSARREWQRIRIERARPVVDDYNDFIAFLKNKTGLGGLISGLFLVLWLYPLGTFAGTVLLAVLLPFLVAMVASPMSVLIGIAVIVGVVLVFFSPSFIRSFFKRRALMRRLKRVCRECGYELTVTGHPYLSLLHYRGGADFSVKVGERQYDCKLLGAILHGGKMLFGYDGKVEIHHYIRFFWAAHALNTATMHTFEQSTFHTVIDYSFDSEYQRVLIVCPAAPQTFITGPGGGSPIDTGARIGEYRMFNTTGFLGALERDCLER